MRSFHSEDGRYKYEHAGETAGAGVRNLWVYGVIGGHEAVRRGLDVVVGGRDPIRTEQAAKAVGAPSLVVSLDDPAALDAALSGVDVVAHCAGPYERTAAPMVDACLRTATPYLDLTGEVDVFEVIYARDAEARAAGVALIPGVGFDVVPTDYLVAKAHADLPSAIGADVAVISRGGFSKGTLATVVLGMSAGNWIRHDGKLVGVAHGHRTLSVDLPRAKRATVASTPLGDLATAARTADLRDVTTFAAMPAARLLRHLERPLRRLLAVRAVTSLVSTVIGRLPGPSDNVRAGSRSAGWVRLYDDDRRSVTRAIEVDNTYTFTARSMVEAAVQVTREPTVGALTPSHAFGVDFIHTIPDITITDVDPTSPHTGAR